MTIKGLGQVKINSVEPLYFIIDKINGYTKEINENKYLALIPNNENKDTLKKYEKLWTKMKDHIRQIKKLITQMIMMKNI